MIYWARDYRVESSQSRRSLTDSGGILHRLDKDASGVIVVAMDLEAQVFVAERFKERPARKEV
ncbi:MAG: pseudouridine synthase [Spirochaetaceae bacterium]|nr:pseudouridine synthase [Spirochaetaceae bacterium]